MMRCMMCGSETCTHPADVIREREPDLAALIREREPSWQAVERERYNFQGAWRKRG